MNRTGFFGGAAQSLQESRSGSVRSACGSAHSNRAHASRSCKPKANWNLGSSQAEHEAVVTPADTKRGVHTGGRAALQAVHEIGASLCG